MVGELLWHAAGVRGSAQTGRAGLPIEWRPTPSAGALHPIHLVCIASDQVQPIRLYDPSLHAFRDLVSPPEPVYRSNGQLVRAVLGSCFGVTVRLVADMEKARAAYENADSLVLRDAGCMLATIGLCAEAMRMRSSVLGFLGDEIVAELSLPPNRFAGIGGIQVSASGWAQSAGNE
jgi:hypothetical protein